MSPEQRRQYRAIGARMALYLREAPAPLPAPAALQAMAADLAAEHSSLVLPLKDLVNRPVFRTIAAKAGSGGGALERHALLQEMGETFSPQVVEALAEVLTGLLDLPAQAATAAGGAVEAPAEAPAPTPLQAPLEHQHVPTPWAGIIAVIGGGLLAAAALVLVVSRPEVCGRLGLCSPPQADNRLLTTLDAASRAEQELRRAQTVESYRHASQQLEQELLRLNGANLSAAQQEQLRQLQQSASQAREILRQEVLDQQRLDRARQILEAARSLSGPALLAQLDAASREVEAVPPRSFSADAAQGLRERLLQLRSAAATTPAAEPSPPVNNGSADAAPASPQPSAPIQPPGNRDGTPYRDQPLF